jgi:hypothetical protein
VPERDRYQVVTSHLSGQMVALDTGLGIDRSDQLVIVHVVSRARTPAQRWSSTGCWPSGCDVTAVSTPLI